MLINNAHPGADFKIFNIETVRSGHYLELRQAFKGKPDTNV